MSGIEKHILQIDLMEQNENEPIKVTQGDYGTVIFEMNVTVNGDPVDLTGNNVNIVIDNKNSVGICTIIDASKGIVKYALTKTNTATIGVHQFVLELITANSRVTTEKEKYTVIEDLNS